MCQDTNIVARFKIKPVQVAVNETELNRLQVHLNKENIRHGNSINQKLFVGND